MARMKIQVNVPPADAGAVQYDVRIGAGVLEKLGAHLAAVPGMVPAARPQLLMLTDDQVGPLYTTAAKASLTAAGYRVRTITVPFGEGTKSLEVAAEIWEAMAQLGLGRDCAVVALGGGVVGDLAGFVAANYLRGVPCVQVPTTLLAMVDSSVGGKTAVNLAAGKNLVGAFLQPAYVCADIACLDTLSTRERLCGLAEAAKAALSEGDEFYFWMLEAAPELAQWAVAEEMDDEQGAEPSVLKQASLALTCEPSSSNEFASDASAGRRNAAELRSEGSAPCLADGSASCGAAADGADGAAGAQVSEVLTELVARCVVFKADVVGQDPLEQRGIRQCLNYGHTLGHALEQCAGYGVLTHGEAVAYGMRFAAELGKQLGITPADVAAAQNDLLDAVGLGGSCEAGAAWAGEMSSARSSAASAASEACLSTEGISPVQAADGLRGGGPFAKIAPEGLLEAMHHDKKVRGNELRFVLLRDIGVLEMVPVDDAQVLAVLQAWLGQRG